MRLLRIFSSSYLMLVSSFEGGELMENMRELWVYISIADEKPDNLSMSLLAKAQRLANENEFLLCAVLVGKNTSGLAHHLAAIGVPKVYLAEIPDLEQYEYLRVADVLHPFVADKFPEIFLFPATDNASLVASTLGVRLKTGVTVHCVEAEIRNGIFVGSVPALGGQVMSEILCPTKKPQIATARLGAYEFMKAPTGEIIQFATEVAATDGLRLISSEREPENGVSLAGAELVLCGGAGLGDAEHWEMLKRLAEKLKGAVCCTRNVLDMEIGATENDMVGVSGSSISPKVYIGFGVSGSAYHVCGMKDSKLVLNVNLDSNNPFFKASDYGFVANCREVIAALLSNIEGK